MSAGRRIDSFITAVLRALRAMNEGLTLARDFATLKSLLAFATQAAFVTLP